MHKLRSQAPQKWYQKLFVGLNECILRLALILTFLGIVPLIIFIYYNLVEFNPFKVLIGCVTLLVITKINKDIQGG